MYDNANLLNAWVSNILLMCIHLHHENWFIHRVCSFPFLFRLPRPNFSWATRWVCFWKAMDSYPTGALGPFSKFSVEYKLRIYLLFLCTCYFGYFIFFVICVCFPCIFFPWITVFWFPLESWFPSLLFYHEKKKSMIALPSHHTRIIISFISFISSCKNAIPYYISNMMNIYIYIMKCTFSAANSRYGFNTFIVRFYGDTLLPGTTSTFLTILSTASSSHDEHHTFFEMAKMPNMQL